MKVFLKGGILCLLLMCQALCTSCDSADTSVVSKYYEGDVGYTNAGSLTFGPTSGNLYMGTVSIPSNRYMHLSLLNTTNDFSIIWGSKFLVGAEYMRGILVPTDEQRIYACTTTSFNSEVYALNTTDQSVYAAISYYQSTGKEVTGCGMNSGESMVYFIQQISSDNKQLCRAHTPLLDTLECYQPSGFLYMASFVLDSNDNIFIEGADGSKKFKIYHLDMTSGNTLIEATYNDPSTQLENGNEDYLLFDESRDYLYLFAPVRISGNLYRYFFKFNSTNLEVIHFFNLNANEVKGIARNADFSEIILVNHQSSGNQYFWKYDAVTGTFPSYKVNVGSRDPKGFTFDQCNNIYLSISISNTQSVLRIPNYEALEFLGGFTDIPVSAPGEETSFPLTSSGPSAITFSSFTSHVTTVPTNLADNLATTIGTDFSNPTLLPITGTQSFNLTAGEDFTIDVLLTTSPTNTYTLNYATSQYNAETIPTWITEDYPSSQITGTAPADTSETVYNFYIDASNSSLTNGPYKTLISLTVTVPPPASSDGDCSIENCETCSETDSNVCSSCNEGYKVDTSSGLCVKDDSGINGPVLVLEQVEASSPMTQAAVGGVVAVNGGMAATNAGSSGASAFSMINQLQLLLSFILIDSYVAKDVRMYLEDQDFAMLNLDFLKTEEYEVVKIPYDWMHLDQQFEKLERIDVESQRTINNLVPNILVFLSLILVHIVLHCLPHFSQRKSDAFWWARLWNKLKAKVLHLLAFVVYVRLLLELNELMLLSSMNELNFFSTENTAAKLSIFITCFIVVFCVGLIALSVYYTYRHWKGYDPEKKLYFKEFFADLRPNRWARCYTPLLLIRRAIFVAVIIFGNSQGVDTVFGTLLFFELAYLSCLTSIRPFKNTSNNVIEIMNEVYYTFFIIFFWIFSTENRWTVSATSMCLWTITSNSLMAAIVMLVVGITMLIQWWKKRKQVKNKVEPFEKSPQEGNVFDTEEQLQNSVGVDKTKEKMAKEPSNDSGVLSLKKSQQKNGDVSQSSLESKQLGTKQTLVRVLTKEILQMEDLMES